MTKVTHLAEKSKIKRATLSSQTYETLASHFEITASGRSLLDHLTANVVPWLAMGRKYPKGCRLRKAEQLIRRPPRGIWGN